MLRTSKDFSPIPLSVESKGGRDEIDEIGKEAEAKRTARAAGMGMICLGERDDSREGDLVVFEVGGGRREGEGWAGGVRDYCAEGDLACGEVGEIWREEPSAFDCHFGEVGGWGGWTRLRCSVMVGLRAEQH